MNEHKEVVGFGRSSWPAEETLWAVSIALGTLIAAAESVFGSTTALLVGISLAMNPFCFQAKARNARLFGATKSDNQAPLVHVSLWPESKSPIGLDTKIEKRIDGLLKRMTVGEKVSQVIQPEWKSISPAEVAQYHIGSIENGGGAVPGGNKHSSVQDWVNLVEPYYDASVDPARNRVIIPLIWASDAVHGHNNVYGATLFPHNIGLGAAHDRDLIRRIGEVTAAEMRSTGMDWSFAPTIAVARDDRWGRTYESYSEDPKIAAQYAAAIVEGLEGSGSTFLDKDHVISTAKHFLGDGLDRRRPRPGRFPRLRSRSDPVACGRLYPGHRCRHTVNYGIL